jgi:hypothetical protein
MDILVRKHPMLELADFVAKLARRSAMRSSMKP